MVEMEGLHEVELLRQVVETIDVGVFVANHDGEAIIYNDAMARLEGLTREQVLGRHVLEIFPSLSDETSTILQVLQTGVAIIDRHQTYLSPSGRRITTINTTIPILKRGQIVGALETSKDITWLKELSEKVMDLQRALLRRKSRHDTTDGRLLGAHYVFDDILGQSPALRAAVDQGRLAARTSSSVLIYGETGTGKELFAQSIHNASPRRDGPFIAQNCAAIPASLLEGILFGTSKGSFTGAVDRPGLFEQAQGGTLLLDELNAMSVDLQAKLLRTLQEGTVRRVGATRETSVDVRVIATTNQEPRQSLADGTIRHDLFYRLSVVTLMIPPLRERYGDLEILTSHFIDEFNHRFERRIEGIASEVRQLFLNHPWPGNIRQLRHCIEGAFNMATDESILQLHHLPAHLRATKAALPARTASWSNLPQALAEYERHLITEQLTAHQGNVTRAAAALGISRQLLQYKLRKYLIEYAP